MIIVDAAYAGQITTVAIICSAIALFLGWLGLLALADAEERANREADADAREDWRARQIVATPLHMPDMDDRERFVG